MNTKTMTGQIESVTRRQSSRNGNPRFAIKLYGQYPVLTAVDTSVAYEVQNFEYLGVNVVLTLDGRGNVIGLDLAK